MDAVSDELNRALREAVGEAVAQYGGSVSDVRRDVDFDGDECLFVEIDYSRPQQPIDPLVIARLDGRLRDVAYRLGERGALYVRNHFPHDQAVIGSHSKTWLGDTPRR